MKKVKTKVQVRIPKKVERILLYLGGVLLVVLVYLFVFQRMQLTNQELETKVSSLRTEEMQLREMKSAQKEHEQATREMSAKIDDILDRFPESNLEEDIVSFAQSLEVQLGVDITALRFSGRNLMQQGENSGYVLYTNPVEYNFLSGYENMKGMVAAITGASSGKNVESIVLSYDSDTGMLNGTMVINEFSLSGNGRIYEPLGSFDVTLGNNNPFATAE